MFRRVSLTTVVLFYTMALSALPAIADDEWDSMGRCGDSSLFVGMIFIAIIAGIHHVLKEIDRYYIFTIILACAVCAVAGIISYQVFDYKMGCGWFITIFIASIYFEKKGSS